jgi:hypothetical protein
VRTPPGRELGERVVDQVAFVHSWSAGVERVVLVEKDVCALKAGVELVCQPPLDAPDIMMVKDLGRQISEVARPIAVEEAAQRYRDMTGIAIHRPPDEALDVAHQVVIQGRPIARVLAWHRAFLGSFSCV